MRTTRWWAFALALSAGCSSTVGATGDASVVDAAMPFDGGSEVDVAVATDSGRCSLANGGDGEGITPGPSAAPYVVDLALDNSVAECALMSDGSVRCRGGNAFGQLGRGNTDEGLFPSTPVVGLSDVVQLVGSFQMFACALRRDGTVWCWGSSAVGALGVTDAGEEDCSRSDGGRIGCRTAPTRVTGLTDVAQVAMGLSSVCAVKRDGTVWCWGNDRLIPGGRSEVPAQTALTEVASITGLNGSWWVRSRDGSARVIANDASFPVGAEVARNEWGFHACYRLPDATMRCEGANPSGVLGDGRSSGDLRARFAAVDPGLCGVQQIAAGIDQTCALLVDGAVWCWGEGVFSPSSGLLEDCRGASTTTRCVPRPSRVAIDRVLHIAVGPSGNCAIRDDHSVWCWSAGDPARVDW